MIGRTDALFELIDAVLCADHAVTSLVELSLGPEFRRGHGALYDALAAGALDEDAFADLLVEVLPMSGPPRRALAGDGSVDEAEPGGLADVLAALPPDQARAVREACLPRGGRPRFAIDGTLYPRPDAECSPGRWHVHHDACRCDGSRKTIPGWEHQFVAALGQLRSAWTALILPDTARYGTVGIACWRHVHPKVHGDRTYFADWDGDLPIIKGNLVRVHVQHLPDGRTPPANLWLWHAGPAVLPIDEVWRAYLARFDEEHSFKVGKGVLRLIAAKLRTRKWSCSGARRRSPAGGCGSGFDVRLFRLRCW